MGGDLHGCGEFCKLLIHRLAIHTPSCIWRRTGEIQKANQEFANLTGIPASMFRNGQLCVYELMDEDSAVRYWEGYAKIAFDAGECGIRGGGLFRAGR